MRIGNLLTFMVYIILVTSPEDKLVESDRVSFKEDSYHLMYLFSISLSLLGQIILEGYFDYKRYLKSEELNNAPATILQRFTNFNYFASQHFDEQSISVYKQVKAKDIQVGDIVFVRKNEIFPADIIVLDIYNSYCSSNNSYSCGKTTQNKIYPVPITYSYSKTNYSFQKQYLDFRKLRILTGKIEYVSANERNNSKFEGFIKVSKDPVGTVVAKENIGYRGSILEYSDWVIGVAIYTGNECYYFKDTNIHWLSFRDKKPFSYFEFKKEKYFSLYFFLFIFCCLISVIRTHLNTCYSDIPEKNSLGEYNIDKQSFYVGLGYFCDYMLYLPQFYYFFCDFVEFIQAFSSNIEFENQLSNNTYKIENQSMNEITIKIEDKPSYFTNLLRKFCKIFTKNSYYLRSSSKPIEDLSIITDCFIDKTGTLTKGRSFEIDKIILQDIEYLISDNFNDPIQVRKIVSIDYTSNDPSFKANSRKESMREKRFTNKQIITLITNEVTDQQNDIAGEEGIFLRKDIPTMNQVKHKNEVDAKNDFDDKFETENKDEQLDDQKIKESETGGQPLEHLPSRLSHTDVLKQQQKIKFNQTEDQIFKIEIKNLEESQELTDIRIPNKIYNYQNQSQNSAINTSGERKIKEQVKNLEVSKSLDTDIMFFKRKPTGSNNQFFFTQQTDQRFYEEIQSNQQSFSNQKEAILAMVICHISKSFINRKTSTLLTDHQSIYDSLFISFAKRFECRFRCVSRSNSGNMEYISTLGKKTYIHQLHIPPVYNERGNRLQLLVQYEDQYYIYVREEITTLPTYIKNLKFMKEKYQIQIQNMTENGQIGIVFSKKLISPHLAQQMIEKYLEITKIIDYSQLYKQTELIYRENICDMDVISMVSIKEKLNENSEKLIQNFKKARIHVWMVSGDDYIRAITAAFNSKIIDRTEKNELIHFNQSTDEEINFQIQNSLNKLKEILEQDGYQINNIKELPKFQSQQNSQRSIVAEKQAKNYLKSRRIYIIVNGETLTKIMENEYYKDHFMFLTFFCDSFIGYQLTPQQKSQLINLKKSYDKDCIYTLAIGDGFNDIQMMRSADYSIQVLNNKSQDIYDFHGLSEIGVRSLDDINKLIFEKSQMSSKNFEHLLVFTFYRQSFLFSLVFFWNFMQCSYGDMIYSSKEILVLNALCFLIDFLQLYFKTDLIDKKEIAKQLKQFERGSKNNLNYSTASMENSQRILDNQKLEDVQLFQLNREIVMCDVLKNFFLNILPQAIISGLILFCIPYYSLGLIANEAGMIIERSQIAYSFIVLFVFKIQINIFILCEYTVKKGILQLLYVALFMIIFYVANYQDIDWDSFISISIILSALTIIFFFLLYSILFKVFYPLLKIGIQKTVKKPQVTESTSNPKDYFESNGEYEKSEMLRDTVEQLSQISPDKYPNEQPLSPHYNRIIEDIHTLSPRISIYCSPIQTRRKKLQSETPKIYIPQLSTRRNSNDHNSTNNFFKLQRVEQSYQTNSPLREYQQNFNFSEQKGDSINEQQNIYGQNDSLSNQGYNGTNIQYLNDKVNSNDISDPNSLYYNNKRYSNQSNLGELEKNLNNLPDNQNNSVLQRRKLTDERQRNQIDDFLTRKHSSARQINLGRLDLKKINASKRYGDQNESFEVQNKMLSNKANVSNNNQTNGQLSEITSQNEQKSQQSGGAANMNNLQKKSRYLVMQNQKQQIKTKQRNIIRQAISNKRFFQGYEIQDIIRMVFQGRETDRVVLEINPKNYNDISFKVSNIFFRFTQINIEKQFKRSITSEWRFFCQVSSLLIPIICELALAQFMNSIAHYSFGFNILSICFGIHFLLWGLMLTPLYVKRFFLINCAQLLVRIISRIILILDDQNFNINTMQALFYSSIIQYSIVINPPLQLASQVILSTVQCIVLSIRFSDEIVESGKGSYLKVYIILQTYCFVISFSLFIFFQNCIYQIMLRKNFERINKLQNESKKMNDVLAILLPKFIRDSINEKGLTYQEDQGEVAILFCDICDFDSIIEQEKKNIIKLLDKLFRMYDESCSNYGLQKIETVGKTYMAAGGLKGLPPLKKYLNNNELIHPVTNCVLMAYDMYENAKKIQYGSKQTKLSVKIGIHYGSVMAGVIGGHKPQFSLIGDTVNMASRVCSTGAGDSVTLSSEAKVKCFKQLEYLNRNSAYFNLKYKIQLAEKSVEAKGKGLIQTFQIIFQRDTKKHLSRFYNIEPEKTSQSSNGQVQPIPSNNLDSSVQILALSTNLSNNPTNNKDINNHDQSLKHGQFSKCFNDKNILAAQSQDSYQLIENISPLRKGKFFLNFNKNDTVSRKISHINLYNNSHEIHAHPFIEKNGQQSDQQVSMHDTLLKILGNDVGVIPNIEYQNDLKNENIDLDRIQQNFNEIDNEISTIQSSNKQITKNISFYDLLRGKYNNEFQIFQMETILNDVQSIKSKGYFLLTFEIIKLIIVNLMTDFLGSRGTTICLVLHAFSIILLISLIFGYHKISKFGVNAVKMFMFLCYLFIIGALVYEGYSFVSQENNKFFNQTQTSAVIIVFSMFLSIKFYSIIEKIFYSSVLITMFLLFSFNNNIARIEYCYITIAIILTQLYNSFQHLELSITSFQNRKKLDVKINEQNKLLQYLLPQHIRDRFLKNQAKTINLIDNFDNVTILYADIAGFTKYSASVRPEKVVFMLRELFTKFDQKCQENNVFKLYTIGDCYVVMGLVNVENRDVAKEAMNDDQFYFKIKIVIEMGFCMIDIIQQVRAIVNFDELEMRIGIHTGSIIGGVVGTGVVRYDIYGPDVVIANKMESNGESGRVMISETTYNLIQDQCNGIYEFENEKVVNIPAQKKSIKSYLVKKMNRFESNYSLQYIQSNTK